MFRKLKEFFKKTEFNTEFIKNAGACIVSKNILEGKGRLTWILREKGAHPSDTGWRFFSNIDTDEYINNPNNMVVCDFNTVVEIEPAIIGIYNLPVGTDFQLVKIDGKIKFFDNITEKEIDLDYK